MLALGLAEKRRRLAMSMYARLLGIAAVVSGLDLPEALLAGMSGKAPGNSRSTVRLSVQVI
jgi:hypothetical protein